jgi:hypothetical protein
MLARSVGREAFSALRGLIVSARHAYKSSHLARIALILSIMPLLAVLVVSLYINFNRTDLPDLDRKQAT